MNRLKMLALAATASLAVLGSTAAQAYPGHFYGHGPRWGVGIYVDPFVVGAYPWWGYGYSPYYAYPPVVVTEPAAPTVYVEQNQQAPVQQQQVQQRSGDWYYCRKPEGYYPYVRNCTEAWQRVPAQPPAQQ